MDEPITLPLGHARGVTAPPLIQNLMYLTADPHVSTTSENLKTTASKNVKVDINTAPATVKGIEVGKKFDSQ